jgi:hypothetical protein
MSTRSDRTRIALSVIGLLPCALPLSGCGIVVLGALGGAGALGYQYATANQSVATDATPTADPPAPGSPMTNPFPAPTATRLHSPTPTGQVLSMRDIRPNAVGKETEAAERPGATDSSGDAAQGLPSTVAGNLLFNQNNGPANPFVNASPQAPVIIATNGLTVVTSFTAQQQTSDRNVVRLGQ